MVDHALEVLVGWQSDYTWKWRTYEMFYWFLVLEIMLIQKLHDATLASLSNFFYSRFKITLSVQIFM